MKRLFSLIAAAFIVFSCSESKEENKPLPSGTTEYVGKLIVTFRGEDVVTDDVAIALTYNKDAGKGDILFKAVKFVPQMPVTLDIDVPGVAITRIGEQYAITGNNIKPTAGGIEYEQYLVTDMIGQWDGTNIDVSLNFGPYPTRFVGEK